LSGLFLAHQRVEVAAAEAGSDFKRNRCVLSELMCAFKVPEDPLHHRR
jgi:hypothetical protein